MLLDVYLLTGGEIPTQAIPATLYLITEEHWHLGEEEERLHNELQRSHSLEQKTGQVVYVHL